MSNAKKPASKTPEELQSALQALISRGRKEGVIRATELNALLEQMELTPEFIKATHTCWKHLIRDPLIYDLVKEDSEYRDFGD